MKEFKIISNSITEAVMMSLNVLLAGFVIEIPEGTEILNIKVNDAFLTEEAKGMFTFVKEGNKVIISDILVTDLNDDISINFFIEGPKLVNEVELIVNLMDNEEVKPVLTLEEMKYNAIALAISESIKEMTECDSYESNDYITSKINFLNTVLDLISNKDQIISGNYFELSNIPYYNNNIYLDDNEVELLEKLDIIVIKRSLILTSTCVPSNDGLNISHCFKNEDEIKYTNVPLGNIINVATDFTKSKTKDGKTIEKIISNQYFIGRGCEYITDHKQKQDLIIKDIIEIKKQLEELEKEEEVKKVELEIELLKSVYKSPFNNQYETIRHLKDIRKNETEFSLGFFIKHSIDENFCVEEQEDNVLFHYILDDEYLFSKIEKNNIKLIVKTESYYFPEYTQESKMSKTDYEVVNFEFSNNSDLMRFIDTSHKDNIERLQDGSIVCKSVVGLKQTVYLVKSNGNNKQTLEMLKLLNY